MTFNISKIVVVSNRSGSDKVLIFTDLPSPIYGDDNLVVSFSARKDGGSDYVRENLNREPDEIIR